MNGLLLAPSAPARSGILQSSSANGFRKDSAGFTGKYSTDCNYDTFTTECQGFFENKNTCRGAAGIFIMGVMEV